MDGMGLGGRVTVQVDTCEPLFKKPGMKHARKWKDITVSGVQMKSVKLFYLPKDELILRTGMLTIKIC